MWKIEECDVEEEDVLKVEFNRYEMRCWLYIEMGDGYSELVVYNNGDVKFDLNGSDVEC